MTGGAVPLLTVTTLQSGLRIPWDVAPLPDGRMLVSERVGNLLVYQSTAPGAAQLANNPVVGTRENGEGGLMGIAVDPDFALNSFIYVCASRDDEGQYRNQVLRYKLVGNLIAFDAFVIRRGMVAAGNHNGCRAITSRKILLPAVACASVRTESSGSPWATRAICAPRKTRMRSTERSCA